jgi:23S rRNA (pseudouridine1915-N3)-methyltransferase
LKARLLAIGRIKPGPEAALFAQHNARLRPPLEVSEFAEARGSPAEIRRREGAAILAALPVGALLVAMDLGGAEGLDPSVLARAEARLSLGPLTWPHFLVRGLLAEQLFRAQCIREGHPYHRAWRP